MSANTGASGSLALSGAGSSITTRLQNIGALSINDAVALTIASGSNVSTLSALSLSANATLSLNNNRIIIEPTATQAARASQIQSLQTAVTTARSSPNGVHSSGLAANLRLAVIDNASLPTSLTTFANTTVDANAIFLAPELLGDSNIDGHVDLNDLNTVLNRLGATDSNWTHGNFDGASTIDLNDLNAVLNNLGTSYANNSSVLAAEALIATPTPEPASLALLSLAAPLLLKRRK